MTLLTFYLSSRKELPQQPSSIFLHKGLHSRIVKNLEMSPAFRRRAFLSRSFPFAAAGSGRQRARHAPGNAPSGRPRAPPGPRRYGRTAPRLHGQRPPVARCRSPRRRHQHRLFDGDGLCRRRPPGRGPGCCGRPFGCRHRWNTPGKPARFPSDFEVLQYLHSRLLSL